MTIRACSHSMDHRRFLKGEATPLRTERDRPSKDGESQLKSAG
jgi:hypothetical protein